MGGCDEPYVTPVWKLKCVDEEENKLYALRSLVKAAVYGGSDGGLHECNRDSAVVRFFGRGGVGGGSV